MEFSVALPAIPQALLWNLLLWSLIVLGIFILVFALRGFFGWLLHINDILENQEEILERLEGLENQMKRLKRKSE